MGKDNLHDLEKMVRELVREWAGENPDENDIDYDGSLHEIVDGCVPIYTGDIIKVALDNLSLATAEPEAGPAFDGPPTPTNIIAANIYEHLWEVANEEWREILEEREEAESEEE